MADAIRTKTLMYRSGHYSDLVMKTALLLTCWLSCKGYISLDFSESSINVYIMHRMRERCKISHRKLTS